MDLQPLTTLPSPSHSHTYLSHYHPSLPTSPSILSRPSSSTRLRISQSNPRQRPPRSVPTSTSTPTINPRAQPPRLKHPGRAHTNTPATPSSRANINLNLVLSPTTTTGSSLKHNRAAIRTTNSNAPEDDWLTRTASTLTLARLEEKGVSWLAARESSTSLTGQVDGRDEDEDRDEPEADDEFETATGSHSASGWASAARSRAQSRRQSQSQSRPGSGMTMMMTDGAAAAAVGPDFVGLEGEDLIDEEDLIYRDDDDEEELVDEGEMRRIVMGRVGGWVDWAVGWMDFRGEREGDGEGDDEDHDPDAAERNEGALEAESQRQLKSKGKEKGRELDVEEVGRRLKGEHHNNDTNDDDDVEENENEDGDAPLEANNDAGALDDVRWLLGVASRIVL